MEGTAAILGRRLLGSGSRPVLGPSNVLPEASGLALRSPLTVSSRPVPDAAVLGGVRLRGRKMAGNGPKPLAVQARSTAAGSAGRRPSWGSEADRAQKLQELMQEIAQTAAKTGPRGVVRFVQGVQALASVSAEWLQESIQAAQQRGSVQASMVQPGPVQLRRLFERLGATYIKLGQFIASAPTLFPAEYVLEFQKCLDRTPPVPFESIREIMRESLGRPLEDVYEFLDPEPLASASVAQVHAARLKGSKQDVVVKVLKPGVEDTLTTDLNFLYVAARVLEFLNPELARTSLVGIVSDIRTSMLEEVDFRKEAVNIEAFRAYVESVGLSSQATAPYVYRHCSSSRVLTLERFYGAPLTDLAAIRAVVPNPEATLIAALNVWFGSLLACETFHADVHAGNLLVLRDGRVGFIDFGIVGRISPSTWGAVQAFLMSVGSGEYRAMAGALAQMGATDAEVDVDMFARDLEQIFEAVQSLDAEVLLSATQSGQGAMLGGTLDVDEQQINRLLLDVVRVSEAYGLRFPREFGLLLKQLLYFDRYTRLLAPSLNVLEDNRVIIGGRRAANGGGPSRVPPY